MEKEQAQSQVGINKKDIVKLETELQNLQDTLLNRQETWMKEKKELQVRGLNLFREVTQEKCSYALTCYSWRKKCSQE